MYQKIRSAKFKSLDGVNGAKPGTFSAVVAVYGNVDSVGDRIIEGAFDQSLKAWQTLGDPIPIVLAHEWKDPFKHIGYAMPNKIKSVPGVGLVVEEGFLDVEDNPLAKQVHKLMERRTLKEFSFGYGIPQGGQTKASDGAMDLRALDLIEFGPCLKGVNDKTELLSIKSQLTHEGVYVPSFEERLELVEAMLLENTKGVSAGRARWRSQRRDSETGKWIDESEGAGHGGPGRQPNEQFGAHKIDNTRTMANENPVISGSDRSRIHSVLNEAEEKFLAGDNEGGEGSVREAKRVLQEADQLAERARTQRAQANKFGFDNSGSSKPGTVSRDDQADDDLSASKEDVAMVTSNMDKVDAMLAAGEDPDSEDDGGMGDLMGNLHVDMEQANFPPAVEKRYAALEKKWQAELDAWSGDGADPGHGVDDSNADDFVLNDLLEEHIGMSYPADYDEGDASDRNQIDGFLQDVISHEEMYTPEQVAAAKRYFGEDSDAASEGTFEVNGEYKTAKELAPDRPWTKLERALGRFSVVGGKLEFQPYTESKKPKGSETQDQRDNSQALMGEAMTLMDSRSKVKTNKVSRDTIHSLSAASYPGYEYLSDSEKADVKDLLDQAEYFLSDGMQEEAQSQYDLAFYMLKLARDNNGHWDKGKSRTPRTRSRLSLDDQISAMQSDAAILSAEYELGSKGFDLNVDPSSDETLRRLAELEGELL